MAICALCAAHDLHRIGPGLLECWRQDYAWSVGVYVLETGLCLVCWSVCVGDRIVPGLLECKCWRQDCAWSVGVCVLETVGGAVRRL